MLLFDQFDLKNTDPYARYSQAQIAESIARSNRAFNQSQGASTPAGSQPASQTMTTATAAAVDEFDSFCFTPDHSLINPSTKAGQTLFNDLSKYSIEEKDGFKGHSMEVENFRKYLKEIQSRCNVQDLLVFETTIHNVTKRHNLAEAPEATSVAELLTHNQMTVWGFNGTADQNKTTVKLADQAKSTEAKKQSLRNAIDIRARNQIIHKILAQSLDPDFLATLVKSKENREHLLLKDSDNGDMDLINGAGASLPCRKKDLSF